MTVTKGGERGRLGRELTPLISASSSLLLFISAVNEVSIITPERVTFTSLSHRRIPASAASFATPPPATGLKGQSVFSNGAPVISAGLSL